jgi:hypothetical protein
MIERVETGGVAVVLQYVRARLEGGSRRACGSARSRISIARTGVDQEELATLAEIGALNAFGHHRESAVAD